MQGIVYILSNKNKTTLYTGVTSNLQRRIAEHKLHLNKGFSDTYNTEYLIYYEAHDKVTDAINRETCIKRWKREWKENLINGFNPEWNDLSEEIGVDEAYLKAIKEAYDAGTLWKGQEVADKR